MLKRTRNYDDDSSSSESGDGDSPRPPQPLPERRHFCLICNKQFSSGKAYGGHVRVHSSEYSSKGKKLKMKKAKRKIGALKKEKEKETDLIRADVEGKIKCCLCGKEFQTMHSLFGHMRRHPDRSWKGIRPPPPPEKFNLSFLNDNNDDDDDDDDDTDDDDVVSRSMMMSDVTEDVQEAAYILMMMYYTEVKSSSCYENDKVKENEKLDGRKRDCRMVDDNESIVDMTIKMENIEVKDPRDEAKRSLGFDLNQPCHEDHPYIY